MSTENLEHEDQNRTPEPTIDIRSNEAPADPEQEIVSQGVHNYSAAETSFYDSTQLSPFITINILSF